MDGNKTAVMGLNPVADVRDGNQIRRKSTVKGLRRLLVGEKSARRGSDSLEFVTALSEFASLLADAPFAASSQRAPD